MNAPVKVNTELTPLDAVYTFRDDLARTYPPANEYERVLLTVAAQAWQRLQEARELELRVAERTDALKPVQRRLEVSIHIARHVDNCQNHWRRVLKQLERMKRDRAGSRDYETKPLLATTPASHRE